MFGFRKSPAKVSNPFESDTEPSSSKQNTLTPARRTSSEPMLITPQYSKPNPFDSDDDDDDYGKGGVVSSKGKLESMSVQELESYAVNKAEETTSSVNNCLRIAEDIRDDGTRMMETLHQQGEQIHRTHLMAVDMDRDLSKGEKLLNNLGGMFSMPWKPKKTKAITGPLTTKDDNFRGKQKKSGQREKLGLAPAPKGGRPASCTPPPEPTNALHKVEMEKAKQDDALSDLSNILGELKGMAVDMGSELNSQNKSLDHLQDDVDELNSRVKGANQRARRLIGK